METRSFRDPQSLLDQKWLLGAIVGLFMIALGLQWNGPQSIAVADGIAYITSGVNLVRTGHFTNCFGKPEDWFPPVYPALIGLLSVGGRLDPMLMGRLVSAAAGLVTVVLVYGCLRTHPVPAGAAAIGAGVLAGNACHQTLSTSTLSNATATMIAFAGFVVWLGAAKRPSRGRYLLLGLLCGLSYLTRPEAIVLLPLWALADCCVLGPRRTILNYLLAFFAMAITMLPYVMYLHDVTGKWTISNKSEVNLAGGRAEYYGGPREEIDSDSLEMGYHRYEITLNSEARRYLHNWRLIGEGYSEIYRLRFGGGLLVCAAVGIAWLARHRQWRLLWGVLVQFAYLPIMAIYAVYPIYLHATLPALSVLIACGLAALVTQSLAAGVPYRGRSLALCIVIWSVLGLAESGSRQSRWVLSAPVPPKGLLRDAGLQFAAKRFPAGVMYENGATLGYYAGNRRGRITGANDLTTLLRYIRSHDRGPVYMAVTSLERYPSSIEELLRSNHPPFEVMLALEDHRGRVVVFRIL